MFCSTLLFAQTETLIIDAQNFQADEKWGFYIYRKCKIKMGQDKLNAKSWCIFFTNKK